MTITLSGLLKSGVLPVTAGGTGTSSSTGSNSLVLSTSPTITSPSITTSLTTSSTSFDLINTAATTVNFAGAATTVNIGSNTSTVYLNHDLQVAGNIYFNGTANQLSATNLSVNDALIYLAANNTADILDIGIVGRYNNGVNNDTHTGLVRDATDSVWKLFSNVTVEPTTTVDFTSAIYDTLQIGNLLTTKVNKVTVTQPATSATLTIADGSSLITSGANSLTLTTTAATNVTFPTSGTLVNSTVSTLSSLSSVGTITTGTWSSTISSSTDATIHTLTVGLGNNSVASNTLVGYQGLSAITVGAYNTAVGYQASKAITAGTDNTSVGYQALYTNQTGNYNISVGNYSLFASTGNNNTAVGYQSLKNNTSGTNNIAVGYFAGYANSANANTTGSNNIYLGYNTVGSAVGNSNEIVIGASAVGLGSNTTVIGTNGTTTSTTIYGTLNIAGLNGNSAGITVKAAADKTLVWTSAENRWVSNIGFQANNPALGGTLGNQEIAARFFSTYSSNGGGIDISHFRDAAGSDWTTAGTRIQQKIDSTWMAWQQFNGNGNPQGISWGTGNSTVSPQAVSEVMRLDNNGNLGIGHTTPSNWYSNSARLVVNQSQNAETMIGIGNTTVGASAAVSLRMVGGTANSYTIDRLNDANGAPWMQHDLGSGVTYRSWTMGGTEKLRLNTNGLYVYGSALEARAANTSLRIRSVNSSSESTRYPGYEALHYSGNLAGTADNGGFSVLELFRSRGTEATKLAVQTNDQLGSITGWGWNTAAYDDVARINFFADNTFTTSDARGRIEFQTQTGTTLSTAMTIYSDSSVLIGASGRLGIGTTAGSDSALQVNRPITSGTNEYMMRTYVTVPSNITGSHFSFASTAYTAASAFTLSNYYHYAAGQAALGAGSVITSQVGFIADSSLIGATNNYGFYGNIPSGSNRYNLYMAGTADNYLAGNVGIGTTSPSARLHVKTASVAAGEAVIFENGTNVAYSSLYLNLKANGVFRASLVGQQDNTSSGGVFVVHVADSTGTTRERMRIDSTGQVGIGTTAPAYKLQVNGSFAATTKSFVIDHPTKPDMKLRYGSLEGPENGVYIRGRLKDSNVIELPDYWLGLVDENTITVNLTAIGKIQKLYIKDIKDNTVIVGGKNINCFYTVFAERKDVEKLIVEF